MRWLFTTYNDMSRNATVKKWLVQLLTAKNAF